MAKKKKEVKPIPMSFDLVDPVPFGQLDFGAPIVREASPVDMAPYPAATPPPQQLIPQPAGQPQPLAALMASGQLPNTPEVNAAAAVASNPEAVVGQATPAEIKRGLERMGAIGGADDQMIAYLKKELDALKNEDVPINFQPLAALSDAWYGGNLAASARPTETIAQRRGSIQNLQEMLRKQMNQRAQLGMQADQAAQSNAFARDKFDYSKGQDEEANKQRWFQLQTQRMGMESAAADRADKRALARSKMASKNVEEMNPKEYRDLLASKDRVQKSDDYKKAAGIVDYLTSLNEMERLVNEVDASPLGPDAPKFQAQWADLAIKFKEAAKLGAIAGPDMGLILQQADDPTKLSSFIKNELAYGGKEGVLNRLKQGRKNLVSDYNRAQKRVDDLIGSRPPEEVKVLGDSIKSDFMKVKGGYEATKPSQSTTDQSELDQIRAEMKRRGLK